MSSRTREKAKRLLMAAAVGGSIALLFSLALLAGALEPLELKTIDHRFTAYEKRHAPSPEIVIITIDQNSIDYLKNKLHILWKWPRDVYAFTLEYATKSGAAAVLLDFDFSDPDLHRVEYEAGETDSILGAAIRKSGLTVNSARFEHSASSGQFAQDSTDYATLGKFSLPVKGAQGFLQLTNATSAVAPITELMEPSLSVGSSNAEADPDGVLRRMTLFQSHKGTLYPSTALALAMAALKQNTLEIDPEGNLLLGGHRIALDPQSNAYISWYGPGGPEGGTYKYIPIADVIVSYLRQKEGLEPLLKPEVFKDKVVLIGSNAASLFDLKPTPMSVHGPYPGVEIVATSANNLLDGTAIARESRGLALAATFLMALLVAVMVGHIKSAPLNVLVSLALMAAYYAYAVAAFYRGVIVDLVPPLSAALLTFTSVTVLNYLTEGQQTRWLKKAFSQYTSESLMQELLKNPDKLRLGGEKREMSILFSDIRGFTSISEKLEPEQLTHVLNEYLTPMTEIVFRHGGVLDKYIGDAVMALFGAPLEMPDHPEAACRAALDMIAELETLRGQWKRDNMPDFVQNMKIGVGINSGFVSVGNMGSHKRFDYTVIGDNVNLSSRLESTTKLYGVNILVAENTHARAKDRFLFRELDNIKVVGKKQPIKIYELIKAREAGDEGTETVARVREFERGLALYRSRQWAEGRALFQSLYERYQDKAAALYAERCREFIDTPPPEDWDGVFERREK